MGGGCRAGFQQLLHPSPPKLYGEGVQSVCVLILKVPSYSKKIILFLKIKMGEFFQVAFKGKMLKSSLHTLLLRVTLPSPPRTQAASRAAEAGE